MVTEDFKQEQKSKTEAWFNEMVSNLRYDQALLAIQNLEEDKAKVYNALIDGDDKFMHGYARQTSSIFFIELMIDAYFKELAKAKSKPEKLALELSNSKILVWAEIKEDDEPTEDALILSEAKINSMFAKHGFYISSTIVEDLDGLQIPDHYQPVQIA